jgi:phosphate transport system substrate-binding protein
MLDSLRRLSASTGQWLALLLALGLVGCGGSDSGSGDGLGGAIRINGSSTVFPLTEAVAEEFMREHPGVQITVGESGTGGGFAKFLRGETDINDASRPITSAEREKADTEGIGFIEVPVGYDGIAVVAHPDVDWVECLSVRELRSIWAPDSDADTWSDVRDGFPDVPLQLYGPGTASGTYDYFTEAIVGEGGASRSDFSPSEDDNVLVEGIGGTTGALGYFGYAYYTNNADRLTLLSVDPDSLGSGASCTAPSEETIRSGSYTPLARPLFMYVRADALEKDQVRQFVNFYLSEAGTLASAVGYVGLSETAYDLAQQRVERRITGTLFGQEDVRAGADVETVLRNAQSASAAPDSTVASDQTP